MKKLLVKKSQDLYHIKDGIKINGAHNVLRGDYTGLRGDCTDLRGDCSSGLMGDCTGLIGCCSNVLGDIDSCEITESDREEGITIDDLIA